MRMHMHILIGRYREAVMLICRHTCIQTGGWAHLVRPDIFLWRGHLKVRIATPLKFLQDPAGWTLLSRSDLIICI